MAQNIPDKIDGVKRVIVDGNFYYASDKAVKRFKEEEGKDVTYFD